MLVNSSVDEVKRREAALRVIKSTIKEKGRNGLYDLTGLSGGFPLVEGDIRLLETYAGSAIFEDAIQVVGRIHLGGDKILALNRTSSGILAAILALVKEGDEIVHYLPKHPAHPSIPRSAELVGASYREFDDINDFEVGENTSLVFITGSTMDHEIIDKNDFLKVIKISKSRNVPVFVDDASGARLRTVIYKQPRAMDMGADMAITSTDKLMDGPRGGLMAGKADIMDLVKSKAQQFGLEAQSPLVAGMVRAFENFSPEKILEALSKKHEVCNALKKDIKSVKETPTGVMLSSNDLKLELENRGITTRFSALDLSDTLAMLFLRKQNIITIPAVGMPGASPTIRIDLASQDAGRIGVDLIVDMFKETFSEFESIAADEKVCRAVLYA
ncbi:TIGR03576 family pyridoxal phosphate-dependent enzyme [Methanobacterium paludis]|uniref:Pyridoxal phosphate enzyme n=1 Tax=Methanobacterium paludis (strain DSM 25820 / JCM 18151 / SWAN1) TaxID=868131 RepID=F6D7W9_METPW|nr:TIGR03576 family pyridoxal phosphate-dependent enzyme [Methanobacterium paludis]AEG18492.1 pyridoxal phosphate enzyme [Methanobacterium paludis]